MKKAKIMLTAIALFAVVGGAMAFKARFGSPIYTTAVYNQPGALVNAAISASQPAPGVLKVYTTALPNQAATVYTYTFAQP